MLGAINVFSNAISANDGNPADAAMLHLKCLYATAPPSRPDAIFQNVEKIIIVVVSEFDDKPKEAADLSKYEDVLQTESLSNIAAEVYTLRFKDLGINNDQRGCYGRNDQQPVIYSMKTPEERHHAKKLSEDENTLTVYLKAARLPNNTAELLVVNYRPRITRPWYFYLFGFMQPFWEADGKSNLVELEGKDKEGIEYQVKRIIALNIN